MSKIATQSDAIYLKDLIRLLWDRRWVIIAVVVVVSALFFGYASTIKPVYRATAHIRMPEESQITPANYGRLGQANLPIYRPDYFYHTFTRVLQSDSLKQSYLASLDNGGSNGAVLYVMQSKIDPEQYDVSVEGNDKGSTQAHLKGYLDAANSQALQEINSNSRQELVNLIEGLAQKISTLQATAETERLDKLIQLREAFSMAKTLGIEQPNGSIRPRPISGAIETEKLSMDYLRGSKALAAEIKSLETRSSNDPFIQGLRSLEAQRDLYTSLLGNTADVKAYVQDGPVQAPAEPIKPKKGLFLVLGLIAGGVLASIGVLISANLAVRRSKNYGAP